MNFTSDALQKVHVTKHYANAGKQEGQFFVYPERKLF